MDLGKAISSTGELLFEFASSLILIPKTLIKVLVRPTWASEYLTTQSSDKAKARFEKYSHPTLFWIVVGILPYYFAIHLYFVGYTEGEVLKAYKTIGATNIITGIALFLVSLPVSCSFILHIFKHRGITKTSYKKSFLLQLYVTAPYQLFYLSYLFIDSVESEWAEFLLLFLFLAIHLWFVISEIKVIKKELEYNYFLSTCIFSLMYFAGFVFAGICMIIFFFWNMESFQILIDAYFGDIK